MSDGVPGDDTPHETLPASPRTAEHSEIYKLQMQLDGVSDTLARLDQLAAEFNKEAEALLKAAPFARLTIPAHDTGDESYDPLPALVVTVAFDLDRRARGREIGEEP